MPRIAAPRSREPRRDALEHLAVDGRVAHDASLADLVAAGLELRFDQDESPVAGPGAF